MPDASTRSHAPGLPPLPASWAAALGDELAEPWFTDLGRFVAEERARGAVFPAEGDVFAALEMTPYDATRVVLLGQDPYHDDGQAHGLCFSVQPGVTAPPSLVNIFKELEADVGVKASKKNGNLIPWAR